MDKPVRTSLQDLLDKEDPDKLAKIAKITEGTRVDPEDELVAELGIYFGWEAIVAVKSNVPWLTIDVVQTLVNGARKINAANRYNRVIDMRYSSNADAKEFNKHLSNIRKT